MVNIFKSPLKWVATNFKNDAAKMLIATGCAGWAISSAAQIGAIAVNPKIKNEQKLFLIPQEFADMVINIGSYFLITLLAKRTVSKLFTTGKFVPKAMRNYFEKHPEQFKDKIGKIDFNVDNLIDTSGMIPRDAVKNYKVYKNFYTTAATVGGGILATNVVTPILRNKFASKAQKTVLNSVEEDNEPTVQNQQINYTAPTTGTQGMKI